MILILTEKPSVAKDIAGVFNGNTHDGFIYCDASNDLRDEVIITWAFGHLLQIANEFPKGIQADALPVFPDFTYTPNDGGRKQLATIKKQLDTADKVIIATDSGREGELIARLILNHAGWKNWDQTFRFWTSEALTPAVIKKTLAQLKPAAEYNGLFKSALGRQHADWILGLNLSSATSMSAKGYYSIGRVQTPTLRLISDRITEIQSFMPVTYYTVDFVFDQSGGQYEGTMIQEDKDKQLTIEQAGEILRSLQGETSGNIVSITAEKKSIAPPLLHSLTSLQREANELYSYSASDTLEIAQDLYEKLKAISYPRTDSNHMGESSVDLVETIVQELALQIDVQPRNVGKRLFDDSKLTDHYAIIPLKSLPAAATEKQRNVYNLVLRRFHGSFLKSQEQLKTSIVTQVKNVSFSTTGTQNQEMGWKSLYPAKEEKNLPKLIEGSVEIVSSQTKKHITEPPKKYTESTLLGAMEKLGLGTPATRADIIEKLLTRQYIARDQKNLVTTDKGAQLITLIRDRNFADPELTAEWEAKLGAVAKNAFTYDQFITEIKEFTTDELGIIRSLTFAPTAADKRQATPKMIDYAKSLAKQHGEKLPGTDSETVKAFIDRLANVAVQIGKCKCGKELREMSKSYNCDCGRTVWKESFGRKFSKQEAAKLLAGETISVKGLKKFQSKDTYSAKINLSPENKLQVVEYL